MPIADWWWEFEAQEAKTEATERAVSGSTQRDREEAMSLAREIHARKQNGVTSKPSR